jgi:NADH-quinone oxidoreductase subunit E
MMNAGGIFMSEQVGDILSEFPPSRDYLIPILQAVQEKLGYLPPEAMMEVADYTRVPESEVYGVATFYHFFKFSPIGKNLLRICRGTACHVRGSLRIQREIERQLGIQAGQTTEDLQFTLEIVRCMGACAMAPALRVNTDTMSQVKVQQVASILEKYSTRS